MLNPTQQAKWQTMKAQGSKQHLKKWMLSGCLPQFAAVTGVTWIVNTYVSSETHDKTVNLICLIVANALIWPVYYYIVAKLQWSWYKSRSSDAPESGKSSKSNELEHNIGDY